MIKDEIIKLAKQAGFYHLPYSDEVGYGGMVCTSQLLEFANLVAQREREEAEKRVLSLERKYGWFWLHVCIEAIRGENDGQ